MRKSPLSILTVGESVYSLDQRYEVVGDSNAGEFNLKINPTIKEDAGEYECQITSQQTQSLSYHLKVKKGN